jgi:mRNA interferase MazF
MSPELRRKLVPWDIWLIDFGQPIGHEQGGVRPALVVGSTTHCTLRIEMALVVPLTTKNRGLRHHVRIASESSGLNYVSWARTEEIKAVSTERFTNPAPLGTVSAAEIAELSIWLPAMLAAASDELAA